MNKEERKETPMTADQTEKYRQEFQKETGNRFGYEVYVGEVEGLYVRWLESRLSSLEREREELRVDAERYRALRKWHDTPNLPEFNLDEGADALIAATLTGKE